MKSAWFQFLLCLMFASGIWLILMLSQDYTDVVSITLDASSNIDGRASRSSSPSTVLVKCKASGFSLMLLSTRHRTASVDIDARSFSHEQGDYFSVPTSALYAHSDEVVGEHVVIESFVADKVLFRFDEESHKKVPVKAVRQLSFRPQYRSMQDIALSPDSVIVYGEPEKINRVEFVMTESINLKDLRSSVSGTARLEPMNGVRMSTSKVGYSVAVFRCVDIKATMSVGTRNVPEGSALYVFPAHVDVVFHCTFPTVFNPSESVELYVDYNEFASSRSGKCVVRADRVPSDVIGYSIMPELCDCLLEVSK